MRNQDDVTRRSSTAESCDEHGTCLSSQASSVGHSGSYLSDDRNERNDTTPAEPVQPQTWQGRANPRTTRLYLRDTEPKLCERCGSSFLPLKVNRSQRFCKWDYYADWRKTADQSGEKNPNWKGGVAKDHYRYKKRFAEKNPEKVRAHRLVAYAKATGRLVPQPCEECGAALAHAHHEDHSKPLEVRWVCQLCHNRHHHLGVERAAREPSRQAPSEPFLWRGVWRAE